MVVPEEVRYEVLQTWQTSVGRTVLEITTVDSTAVVVGDSMTVKVELAEVWTEVLHAWQETVSKAVFVEMYVVSKVETVGRRRR